MALREEHLVYSGSSIPTLHADDAAWLGTLRPGLHRGAEAWRAAVARLESARAAYRPAAHAAREAAEAAHWAGEEVARARSGAARAAAQERAAEAAAAANALIDAKRPLWDAREAAEAAVHTAWDALVVATRAAQEWAEAQGLARLDTSVLDLVGVFDRIVHVTLVARPGVERAVRMLYDPDDPEDASDDDAAEVLELAARIVERRKLRADGRQRVVAEVLVDTD